MDLHLAVLSSLLRRKLHYFNTYRLKNTVCYSSFLGTCVFWEFATEFYDLGFGVSFEWSQPQTKNITVAVNESDDEEFGEEDKSAENESSPPKPRVDEVLPVVRRPCNEEVIIGSHLYPGRGVYLLKFDNSYSLFRSKTLYYRVYYTR